MASEILRIRTTVRQHRRGSAQRYPLWFLAPALLIFTVFFVGPAIVGLLLSFTNISATRSDFTFVAFRNYELLLQVNGAEFFASVGNQFAYAIFVTIIKTAFGVLLALLLNRAIRGRNFVRSLVYLPIMFSGIVVAKTFQFILRDDGVLNEGMRAVGLGALTRNWLGDPATALYAVASVDTWLYLGWTVVIVLAALQSVPQEMLEAAAIDGAGAVRTFFSITLPSILPAVNITVLLTLISGLKVFDLIFAMTSGGPGNATQVMSTFVQKTLAMGNIGYSTAASLVQVLIITVVAFIVNSILSRKVASNNA